MNYHNITKDDMCNGDGLRVVLWVSGCSHKCKNCQNPITWDPDDGLPFDEDAAAELYGILNKTYISGITFSGGDPLYERNRETIYRIIKEIKYLYPTKTIWLYTGYTFDKAKEIIPHDILINIDVIVDGPYIESLRDVQLKWRGSSNQRVIDVKESIAMDKIVLHCD